MCLCKGLLCVVGTSRLDLESFLETVTLNLEYIYDAHSQRPSRSFSKCNSSKSDNQEIPKITSKHYTFHLLSKSRAWSNISPSTRKYVVPLSPMLPSIPFPGRLSWPLKGSQLINSSRHYKTLLLRSLSLSRCATCILSTLAAATRRSLRPSAQKALIVLSCARTSSTPTTPWRTGAPAAGTATPSLNWWVRSKTIQRISTLANSLQSGSSILCRPCIWNYNQTEKGEKKKSNKSQISKKTKS